MHVFGMFVGPCAVCTSLEGRFHYGGRCCSRCKVFFRSTVRKKAEYTCTKGGECVIQAADRKCCQACRLRRCLAAGLDPKLVHSDRKWDKDALTGRQKHISSGCVATNDTKEGTQKSRELVGFDRAINAPFDGPLGWRTTFDRPARGDLDGILVYYANVDRFVDSYSETNYSHIHPTAPFYQHDLNLSPEEAFLYAPRRLSSRTKILWQADSWLTPDSLTSVWCRQVVHFLDWVSHIPELRELEADDQLQLLATRGFVVGGLIAFHRTLKHAKKNCLLTTGGSFLPLNKREVERAEVVDDFLLHVTEENERLFSLILEPLKGLKLCDQEFILLRLIAFFATGLRLTPAGQEAVRNAGHYYQSILARFLRSKYDERAALERLARILGVIPLMEGVLRALEARMIQATLFNLAEMQGTLTHSLYISKRFR